MRAIGGLGKRVPRKLRTPITEAESALNSALAFWLELLLCTMGDDCDEEAIADYRGVFFDWVADTLASPDSNGDEYAADISSDPSESLIQVACTIIVYFGQTVWAEKANRHEEAWKLAADALYWSGILEATLAQIKNPASELAKQRNAQLKIDALEWLYQNGGDKLKPEKAGEKLWLKYSREVDAVTYTKWIRADKAKKSK